MTYDQHNQLEQRVLVLAPTSKDAALTQSILDQADVACLCVTDMDEVCAQLSSGASAVLLPEEYIVDGNRGQLLNWLSGQPPWSDLPVLVLARPGADSTAVAQAMDLLGNVTVLERPMRVTALVSAVRTALRARSRQYEAREHLAKIEASEANLRDFFDNAAVGLHWVDRDGIILRANQTELDMLGYSPEEYLGHHIAEFHVERDVIEEILTRLTNGETRREYEAQLRCKDGSIKQVLINSNVLWKDGQFIHTRCFTRDISDRKDAEKAQALLAAIVSSSDDAIISKTLDGNILSWNAGAERVFGYTAAEAIGQPITLLIPRERHSEETTLLARLRRGERIEHFETIRIRKDGTLIHVSLTVSPIRDAQGKIIGASKTARDITQLKHETEVLRDTQEQLQVVTDNMAVIVSRCSRDLRYLWVSRGCAAWLGRRAEEVVGRHISEVLGEDAFATIRPYVDRVLNNERVEFELQVPYQHIGRRWVKVDYVPTHDSQGATDGWVAVVVDTTAHHKMEESLREADRRKDEFLAILAHELRNPLAPIRNSLHILRLGGRQDPTSDRVGEMMERQVNHMVRLVDDLLEVSRITRGKIELRKELTELASVVRSAVETSRPLIEAAGHQLALAIPTEPLTLECDPVRLSQVIANLLNNAAKYTDDGGQLWLTVRPAGQWVTIAVRDNGPGIPPEMLPRIFDLFTQVDRHAGRAQGGLGIGLTLVKRLVELHDGSVSAHSEGIGRGSEFVVRLPLAVERRPTPATADRIVNHPSPASAFQRILVVDDNLDAAESLGMLLKLLGSEVCVVNSGQEALDVLATFQPAVVLLDIGMPGMDGHEVARRIRQQKGFEDVKLIALTGWGQEDDRRRSRNAGFDYHLIKPTDTKALETLFVSLNSRTTNVEVTESSK